jgi:hypothetical protein
VDSNNEIITGSMTGSRRAAAEPGNRLCGSLSIKLPKSGKRSREIEFLETNNT